MLPLTEGSDCSVLWSTLVPEPILVAENTEIPLKGDEYDFTKLADTLKDAKTAYPDKEDIVIKSVRLDK